MADHLRPDSLTWALTHILRFGDTDIFPVPFEYKAIENDWDNFQKYLLSIDLSIHETRPSRRCLIPKPRGGYRVAFQLDPIDTIIYTAILYESAELIEKQRVPPERKIACSYRIEIDANGQFFSTHTGWPDFHEKSTSLSESGDFKYVLTADIADFYNQISHHRVRNSLEYAGVTSERAKNLEKFLMSLTALQSRGIPVGPSASILVSEACLSDVDTFLLRKGYIHTRYSDDFRIFCANKREANKALHDLSEFLYTSHRLTTQNSKTKIITIKKFMETALLDPKKLEEKEQADKLNELLYDLWVDIGLGYSDFPGDISAEEISEHLPEEKLRITHETIIQLFDMCLQQNPLNLGLARYLLRRASVLRSGILQDRVLGNLETLAPAMRDAIIYLSKSIRANTADKVGNSLLEFVRTSDINFLPFVQLWIANIFILKLSNRFEDIIFPLFEEMQSNLSVRPIALLAREGGHLDWLREQKEIWNNYGSWDKRAIIWAASVLPQDERRFWLNRVQASGDMIDKAVARAVRRGIPFKAGG